MLNDFQKEKLLKFTIVKAFPLLTTMWLGNHADIIV